jgi:hypothetical protein
VEAKMMRPSLSRKKLRDELIVDIDAYRSHPRCSTLFCLVYDPDRSITNPREVESDLSGPRDKLAVRVMIVPKLPQVASAVWLPCGDGTRAEFQVGTDARDRADR